MIGILQVKHPPQKFPDNNREKYQHGETYKPRKCHIYREIIRKCKFQMAHNPQNIRHSEKMVWQRDITPIKQNISTIPQKPKPEKGNMYMET